MTKLVSRKTIEEIGQFTIHESTVALQNGKEKTYIDISKIPFTTIIALDEETNVYLITQTRYLLGGITLEAVAGSIENGEDPLACAKRELREEAGIEAKSWKTLPVVNLAGSYVDLKVHLFLAQNLTFGKDKQDDDEDIKVVKMTLGQAVEKVLSGEITTAASIIGILMVDKMRQEGKI